MPEFLNISPARVVASAPHSRSGSFKSSSLDVIQTRQRTNSMPTCAVEHVQVNKQSVIPTFCRVRSFKTTSKGVVENRGDCLKECGSNNLMSSGNTVTDRIPPPSYTTTDCDDHTSRPVSWAPSYFTVAMIGSSGVGKSSLSRQFLTSDYVGYDNINVENDEGNKTVSVILNGEESIMEFVENQEISEIENSQIDAFIVAFSITDYSSYMLATNIVQNLRINMGTDRAIILVANKIDLVRQRKVNANVARTFADKYECGYLETSAVLNHHVDELLVSSLQQIRQKLSPPSQTTSRHSNKSCSNKKSSPKKVMAFVSKFLHLHSQKSRSCNNIMVF
ncbi:hypothetical protein LOTGIDRAFT_231352 [Lottia gigantea]|uniref:Small monomeric GTPase n=1 Tax=Lottia gigantea TaxID=225164 RepID=V4C912_LOTGI|nr:hypothetical protein LOTGIDRAFT_231352 [Lottia gigantea]ESO98244.1 hypothetical protein LOTGIDRAFT_231352 [Lottia gigantea]